MKNLLHLAAGLAVLVGGGVVHGLWTGRWQPSPRLAAAAGLLASLPADLGEWKGADHETDAESLALTGAVGHYSRSFTDPLTGDKVLVILLAGKPAHMAVHRPEDCYRAAGYEMAGGAVRLTVRPAKAETAEMFTGVFSRDEPSGPAQIRIFWSWLGDSGWEAPGSPRFRFARQPVLYKLYVIRSTGGNKTRIEDDPSIRLLGELLPVLEKTLGEG